MMVTFYIHFMTRFFTGFKAHFLTNLKAQATKASSHEQIKKNRSLEPQITLQITKPIVADQLDNERDSLQKWSMRGSSDPKSATRQPMFFSTCKRAPKNMLEGKPNSWSKPIMESNLLNVEPRKEQLGWKGSENVKYEIGCLSRFWSPCLLGDTCWGARGALRSSPYQSKARLISLLDTYRRLFLLKVGSLCSIRN